MASAPSAFRFLDDHETDDAVNRLTRVYEALGGLDKADGFRSNQVTSCVQRSR